MTESIVTEKVCNECRQIKNLAGYEIRSDTQKHRAVCKLCVSVRAALNRKRRIGLDALPVSEKQCAACGLIKPAAQFNRDKAALSKLSSWCKSCIQADARSKGYECFKPESRKARALQQYSGMTIDIYNSMVARQKGLCAICQKPPLKRKLVVDHCHKTGVVRSLLCLSCNSGIGLLKDDPVLLGLARKYLLRHSRLV